MHTRSLMELDVELLTVDTMLQSKLVVHVSIGKGYDGFDA